MSQRVELLLRQLDTLPTLPGIAIKLLDATGSDVSKRDDVVRLIESDPVLTSRVLQLVRRADLGARGDIASVSRAVQLLGFDAVRCAVLAVSVFQTFSQTDTKPAVGAFNRSDFWTHCIAVACCCEMLAKHVRGVDANEAFVCGLLHDLGKIALDAALPKSFAKAVEAAEILRGNIADAERHVLGVDHLVAGKRLAEKWNLPAPVRDCVWLHGQMPEALPVSVSNAKLVNLVSLADLIVREQHFGFSGNYTFVPTKQTLIAAAGIQPAVLDGIIATLAEAIESRAASLGLGESTTRDIYCDALARANHELGAIGSQLAAKNRKLATRSKFFDAMTGFANCNKPDASTADIARAIAEVATATVGVDTVSAFSTPPGKAFAEIALSNEPDSTPAIVEIDEARPQTEHEQTDGPVLLAGDSLEWILESVSPKLAHDARFWIPLRAEGRCVGGVIWGAPAGEASRLAPQAAEIASLAVGWALALRTAQVREEARTLSEDLAESNRRLVGAQAEVARARTVATVAEMAAGAAHEMNNPLAVISGRSQLLSMTLSDPKQQAAAQLIFEQSHRLSEMISELMDFARPSTPQPRRVDIRTLISLATDRAKADTDPADRKIETPVAVVTENAAASVTVDVEQVSAALAEIVSNAIHATDAKTGSIQIAVTPDPTKAGVVITVTDNGCGMDEQTQRRAFDPFYSNKPAGRRRGMGLSKAQRWVEAAGGSVRLQSRPGAGTRVVVSLPTTEISVDSTPVRVERSA